MLNFNNTTYSKSSSHPSVSLMCCIMISLLFFMQSADASIFDKYTPGPSDYSVSYLKVLFGETKGPGILDIGQRGNDSLFAVLVRAANTFFLKVATFVLIYQIIAITLDSARSGRFLGEKGSYWLPLRAVVGSSLLIPVGSYCFGQIIVMYIICLGIGLGNAVYTAVVNFGPGSTTSPSTASSIFKEKYHYLDAVVEGALCVALLREKSRGDTSISVGFDEVTSQLYFGTGKEKPCIRTVSIQTSQPAQFPNKPNPEPETLNFNRRLASVYTKLSQDLIASFGQYIHKDLLKHANKPGLIWTSDLNSLRRDLRIVISNFQDEIITYQKNLCQTTYFRESQDLCGDKSVDKKLKFGWLGAGMYFRSYLESTNSGIKYPETVPLIKSSSEGEINNQLVGSIAQNTDVTYYKYYQDGSSCLKNVLVHQILENLAVGTTAYANCKDQSAGVVNNSSNQQKNMSNAGQASNDFNTAGKFNNSVINSYAGWFSSNSGQDIFKIDASGKATWGDPFKHIVEKGGSVMSTMAGVYLGVSIPIVFANLGAHIFTGQQPVGHTYDVVQTVLMAVLTITFTIYYTLGSMAAITLPLVPSIIYLIAGIGWFVQVIFSVVSAPVVAIGIIWPDKNEGFMGKSAPAVMMYLNLLLRPALMIVGLFTGVILCSIGFYLIIAMFALATENGIIQNRSWDALAQLVYGFALFSLMIAVAQKTFLLITLLPDRVLTWIGGSASSWSFTQDTRTILSSVKEGADKGVKEAIRLNKSSTDAAMEVANAASDVIDKAKEKALEAAKAASGAPPSATV